MLRPSLVQALAQGLVLIVWLVVVSGARAQEPSAAAGVEALVERGISLREQRRDEEAVAVFREAQTLDDSPRVQTQLGLALLASGEFVEAYELLDGALASHDPWVEARRSAIEASFASASQHVGLVEIVGGEPGAEVSLNGRVFGALPLARPVHALVGRAIVEASLEGYHRFSSEVVVEPGRTARLRVALVPRPAVDPGRSTGSADGWVWPVVIAGSLLVVAGVVTGLAIGLQPPSYQPSDVGGVVMTLVIP